MLRTEIVFIHLVRYAALYTLVRMLSIRPTEDADIGVLFEFQADQESCQMATVASRDRESYHEHMAKLLSNPECIVRTIIEDETIVGMILSWDREGDQMIGYWIGRNFWGRGYASRALELFLVEFVTRPLIAHVVSTNLGSQRVLEKNGFSLISREFVSDDSFGSIELLKYQL